MKRKLFGNTEVFDGTISNGETLITKLNCTTKTNIEKKKGNEKPKSARRISNKKNMKR